MRFPDIGELTAHWASDESPGADTLAVVSQQLTSPCRQLSLQDLRALVQLGGYVHPLFHEPTDETPFPGQALLLVCGGLAEQTPGLPENILALTEITSVRFLHMVTPSTSVQLRIDVLEAIPAARSNRVLQPMRWTLTSAETEHLIADVVMLVADFDGA